jgi:hypothetical protein
MRRLLALFCALLATVAGAGWAAPSPVAAAPLAAAKTCSSSYVRAHLSWGDKCLRAGEFCKVGNKEYLRYGFYCPATGHLRRR